jgi:large subunit ribosomal protein L15
MLNSLNKIGKSDGKRVGRGYGSGKGGHTIGRGQKGHKSRSGYSNPRPGFEGGSMPLSRRIPKLKGFSREYFKKKYQEVALDLKLVDKNFPEGSIVTKENLFEKKLISRKIVSVKVIGNSSISKKLNFEGIKFSAPSQKSVEAAGGSIK